MASELLGVGVAHASVTKNVYLPPKYHGVVTGCFLVNLGVH